MIKYMLFWSNILTSKVKNKFKEQKGEVNVIAIIVLIGIAITLALIFKEQISKLIVDLLDSIGVKAKGAIESK